MKKIISSFLMSLFILAPLAVEGAVSVKGYYKKNGTYVAPYKKNWPDKSKLNNWSTKGNINPYTGKQGTVDPFKVQLKPSVLPNQNTVKLPSVNPPAPLAPTIPNKGMRVFADGSKLNLDTGEVIPPPTNKVVQTPVTRVLPPAAQTRICNGVVWLDCETGHEFICPSTGNPVCKVPVISPNIVVQNQDNQYQQELLRRRQEQERLEAERRVIEDERQRRVAILENKIRRAEEEKTRFEQRLAELSAESNLIYSEYRQKEANIRNTPVAQSFINGLLNNLTTQTETRLRSIMEQMELARQEYRRNIQSIINE